MRIFVTAQTWRTHFTQETIFYLGNFCLHAPSFSICTITKNTFYHVQILPIGNTFYKGKYYLLRTHSIHSSHREHILHIPPTENTFYTFLPQGTHSTHSSHREHILHIPPTFSNCTNIFESKSVDDILPTSPPPPPLPPHFPWPPSDPSTPSLPK
jgi:hypothetical protein